MTDFCDFNFRQTLCRHRLTDFSSLWQLKAEWVEQPNERRSGWSGVSRIRLQQGQDLYLKRQQNHNTRTWRHPLRGIPTFKRELHAAQLFQQLGIPAVKPVFFSERMQGSNRQAILITRGLMDYTPASDLIEGDFQAMPLARKKAIFEHLGQVLRHMHSHRIQHSCLYPKHIFIHLQGPLKIKLIDLEKVRRRLSITQCRIRDFYALDRESLSLDTRDKIRFLHSYFGESKLSPASRRVLQGILRRQQRHLARVAERAARASTADSKEEMKESLAN